jgi:hypothetical protein
MADLIELEIPLGRDWVPVARMVMGGIGSRLELGLDELDDFQLAVERLLDHAVDGSSTGDSVKIAFEVDESEICARVGPLPEATAGSALRDEPRPGELTLRRVLETVVDSFEVVDAGKECVFVTVRKRVRRWA